MSGISVDVWLGDEVAVEARNAGSDNHWISLGEHPIETTIFVRTIDSARRLRDAVDKTIEAMGEAVQDEYELEDVHPMQPWNDGGGL